MRVPHELVSAPILIGGRASNRSLMAEATAFLVGYPTPLHPRCGSTALVTARRNVLRAREECGNVWIRLNTRDGRARDVEITAPWHFPDDPAVDVAAAPFHLPSSSWEAPPIPTDRFVSGESMPTRSIGPGDDLVVLGLFSAPAGAERILPVVRRASVAAMALAPFADRASGSGFSAYLVEVRCSSELSSGSPVLVAVDGQAEDAQYYLLGLVRGESPQDAPAPGARDLDDAAYGAHPNAGIALVTPAAELLPLLEREAFVDFGKNMDRARARETSVEQMIDQTKRAAHSSEFDRFEDLTRRLVNVPKSELRVTPTRQP